MNIHKCKNCNKGFQTGQGLSSHFQHKKLCKAIHYSIACQVEYNHIPVASAENANLASLSTLKTSRILLVDDDKNILISNKDEQSKNDNDGSKDNSIDEDLNLN